MKREPLKVISLWQPWASLIAWGDKQIETRSWPTNYRGLVAIHAAKRWTAEEKIQCREPFFREAMERQGVLQRADDYNPFHDDYERFDRLPKGAIVAVANLDTVIKIREIRMEGDNYDLLYGSGGFLDAHLISPKEHAFGLYGPGRFAWVLSDVRALPEPIPFRGMQGLFDAPEDLRSLLLDKGVL